MNVCFCGKMLFGRSNTGYDYYDSMYYFILQPYDTGSWKWTLKTIGTSETVLTNKHVNVYHLNRGVTIAILRALLLCNIKIRLNKKSFNDIKFELSKYTFVFSMNLVKMSTYWDSTERKFSENDNPSPLNISIQVLSINWINSTCTITLNNYIFITLFVPLYMIILFDHTIA